MNITKWILIFFMVTKIPNTYCICEQRGVSLLFCKHINTTVELYDYATEGNFSQLMILQSELDITTISSKHAVFVELYACNIFQENRKEARFAGLPKLQHLIISRNKILHLKTLSFQDNAELTILNLSHNNLKRIPIIKSDSLKQLDLSGNELTILDMDQFVNLPKLELLVIEHNCFIDVHENVRVVLHRARDHSCREEVGEDSEGSCLRIGRICMEPSFSAEVSSNETPNSLTDEKLGDRKNATYSSTAAANLELVPDSHSLESMNKSREAIRKQRATMSILLFLCCTLIPIGLLVLRKCRVRKIKLQKTENSLDRDDYLMTVRP